MMSLSKGVSTQADNLSKDGDVETREHRHLLVKELLRAARSGDTAYNRFPQPSKEILRDFRPPAFRFKRQGKVCCVSMADLYPTGQSTE